jgi:hypothetical protein
MEAEVVLAGLVFTTVLLVALAADAALVTVLVKVRRGRSGSSSRS